jgi:hypothetical protein
LATEVACEVSHDAKRKALIFLVLALIMTLVIGAGLPRLRFQPGLPLPNVQFGQLVVPPSANSQPVGMPVSALFIVLLLTCLTGFLFFGIYRLLRGSHWKEVLSSFVYFLLVLLVTFGLLFLAVRLLPSSPWLAAASLPGPKPFEYSSVGPVPPILIWLAGLGLLAALISLVVAIIRSRSLPVAGPWALEAEKARLAILAGDNLKDVIVRCYQRMSQALLQEQSLVREPFMTTGEFERLLAAQGVPRDPVHQLTQLFEAVRYGHWQPDAGDEQRALHSLDAILAYSRSTKQAN